MKASSVSEVAASFVAVRWCMRDRTKFFHKASESRNSTVIGLGARLGIDRPQSHAHTDPANTPS